MKTAMNEEMSTSVLETLSLPGRQYQTGTKNQPTHILRAELKSVVRLWQAVLYNNVIPLTHTSDITISRAKLIFCILLQKDVDIATLISNEIHAIVLSKPSKSGAVRPLAFPGLITGLCKAKGVVIPQPLVPIRRKIDHVFVNARYYNPREFPWASRRSRPPPTYSQSPPQVTSPPVPPTEMTHLRHVQLQQAANHRGQLALHSYFYHYTLNQANTGGSLYPWPTPEQFQDAILWPGDGPVFSGGGGEPEQPHVGEQGQRFDAEVEEEGIDGGEDNEEGVEDEGSLSPTF
uniref:Putative plant transposon protein domain-containing protein n=1 Tax=Cajanus cajan TaxID=3821 RepID=A0A151TBG6_CAJCA|nr:hypothetical protein KK1_018969 [Cajanus cajan]